MLLRDLESHDDTATAGAPRFEPVVHAEIVTRPMDVEWHLRLVGAPGAGATVLFTGQVRDHDENRLVRALEYSAHPDGVRVLERLARDGVAGEGVRGVAVSHRVGRLAVGEVALCCAVAADHRKQAIDACSTLVEEIKHRLPVWKHQIFADGAEEWVGSE